MGIRRWIGRTIHDEMVDVHESYLHTDPFLRGIPDNMYLGGLMVRDYLLDPSSNGSSQHQQQLQAIRSSVEEQLRKLEPEVGEQATPWLNHLRSEVKNYWDSLEPIFQWTPEQKKASGPGFLLHDVLPRWSAVVSLAQEVTMLNEADLRQDQRRLEASQDKFQRRGKRCFPAVQLLTVTERRAWTKTLVVSAWHHSRPISAPPNLGHGDPIFISASSALVEKRVAEQATRPGK